MIQFCPSRRLKSLLSLSSMIMIGVPLNLSRAGEVLSSAAMEEPAWDAVFARTQGWTGGDVASSVDLGDGRTLWLFGDTWIGAVADGKHAPGSHMVNNTIAIHPTPDAGGGKPPQPDAIRFFWGPNDAKGKPTAWIAPHAGHGQDARATTNSQTWYWPTGGGIVAPGAKGQPRLILFLARIGKKAGDQSIWGFKSVGGAVAIISNPSEPVEKWRIEQFPNPHAIDSETAKANPRLREISWGAAVHFEPSRDKRFSGGYLYVYGVRETDRLNKQLMLARVPSYQVERFKSWWFYTGKGWNWSPKLEEAAPIADNLVNELSIQKVPIGKRSTFVMVHSQPLFGHHILVRTADRPEGPWSKAVPIYKVPGVAKHPKYFTYAAKAHAHLSPNGQLLISYVINSHDFWAMAADAEIYRPRFVRLSLDRIAQEK